MDVNTVAAQDIGQPDCHAGPSGRVADQQASPAAGAQPSRNAQQQHQQPAAAGPGQKLPAAADPAKGRMKARKKEFLKRRKLKWNGRAAEGDEEEDLETRLMRDEHKPKFGEQAQAPLKVLCPVSALHLPISSCNMHAVPVEITVAGPHACNWRSFIITVAAHGACGRLQQVNLKRKHFVPDASQSRASSRCTAIFQQQMAAAQAAGAGRVQQLQRRQQQGQRSGALGAAQKSAAGKARLQKDGADGRGRQSKGLKGLQARKAPPKRSAVQACALFALAGKRPCISEQDRLQATWAL